MGAKNRVKYSILYFNAQSIFGNIVEIFLPERSDLEKDYFRASYWFLQAAKQGLAEAQYRLAVMYLGGVGIKQNKERAEYWMQKAASQGYLIAIKALVTITEKQPEITSNN